MNAAFLVHSVPGRVRIRIPAKRGDIVYFTALVSALGQCPEVASAKANAHAASILLILVPGGNLEAVRRFAEQHEWFILQGDQPESAPSLGAVVAEQFNQMDQLIARGTGGHLDMHSLFFMLFLWLGVQQFLRGQIMQPAIPMLWRALEILWDIEEKNRR